jgi:hypothetical protein
VVIELLDQAGDSGVNRDQTLDHALPRGVVLTSGQPEQELSLASQAGERVAQVVASVFGSRNRKPW